MNDQAFVPLIRYLQSATYFLPVLVVPDHPG